MPVPDFYIAGHNLIIPNTHSCCSSNPSRYCANHSKNFSGCVDQIQIAQIPVVFLVLMTQTPTRLFHTFHIIYLICSVTCSAQVWVWSKSVFQTKLKPEFSCFTGLFWNSSQFLVKNSACVIVQCVVAGVSFKITPLVWLSVDKSSAVLPAVTPVPTGLMVAGGVSHGGQVYAIVAG